MLARIAAMTLVLALVLMVVPTPGGPVQDASAVPVCLQGPHGETCVEQCTVVYIYNEVRESNKVTEEILPWAACQY